MTLAILILWVPDAGGAPAVPANHLTEQTESAGGYLCLNSLHHSG